MLTLMIKHLDHDNADFGLGETVNHWQIIFCASLGQHFKCFQSSSEYLNEKQSIVKYLCIFETVSLCRVSDFFPL